MATTNTVNANVTVKVVINEKGNPPGKLADAELYFAEGVLTGLKLIGVAVWERRSGGGRNVTVPARQYSVNGERRAFGLLRPIDDIAAQYCIRDFILEAYAEFEGAAAEA
jgi:sporulation protein YlmC with PRC-barrel domain